MYLSQKCVPFSLSMTVLYMSPVNNKLKQTETWKLWDETSGLHTDSYITLNNFPFHPHL